MNKITNIIKIISILFGIGIIFGFLEIFLHSKSLLDVLFITMGLMMIIIGVHVQGEKIETTNTYFLAMSIVNVFQWLIVIYILLYIGKIQLYGDFLIILAIAPGMTISILYQFHKRDTKYLENNDDKNDEWTDKKEGMIYDKQKFVLIFAGFVTMLVCLGSFITSKSPTELYGSSMGIMVIVWGFHRQKNTDELTNYTQEMSHIRMYRESKNIKVTINYFFQMFSVLLLQLFIICYIIFFNQSEKYSLPFALFITFWATFYFYVQIRESDLKYIGKNREKNSKITIDNGYLVCNKCNRYYKLQEDESPEDFTDQCECGGKLEYREDI